MTSFRLPLSVNVSTEFFNSRVEFSRTLRFPSHSKDLPSRSIISSNVRISLRRKNFSEMEEFLQEFF